MATSKVRRAPLFAALVLTAVFGAAPGATRAADADDAGAAGAHDAASGLSDLGHAPDFKLPRHDGGTVVLSQLLQQGPVVLDFWATWCVPCKRALPHYQILQQRYASHGVTFVAVSQDDPRSQSKITPYVRSQKLTFPVLLDGEKRISRQFKVTEIPTSLLITPQGRIVAVHVGYQDGDEAQLEREIRAVLGLPANAAEDAGNEGGARTSPNGPGSGG